MTKDWKIGICGAALVALAFLAYALFGRPPYAFFSLLKYTVATSAALGAWALYGESKRYLPISFCLVLLGGIHLFGKMRRAEWVKFDWGTAVGLAVLVAILLVSIRRRPSTIRGTQVQQRPQLRFTPAGRRSSLGGKRNDYLKDLPQNAEDDARDSQ